MIMSAPRPGRPRVYLLVALVGLALLPGLLYFRQAAHRAMMLTRLNQVNLFVGYRMLQWNWKDTPEEVFCRNATTALATKEAIPNVVHFVRFNDGDEAAEIAYPVFLSIKAALLRIRPREIRVHTYRMNTDNVWWKLLAPHVTLVEHHPDEVLGPHGLNVQDLRIAHQSDLFRLDILMREGGIYLDTDIFALRSFDDLLHNPRDVLLGHEGGNRYGLGNAVIICRPKSKFIAHWQKSYETSFNPRMWNQHSILVPKRLQIQHPELVCPLSPTVFYWPTWNDEHHAYMREQIDGAAKAELEANMTKYGGVMYENQLAVHSWGGGSTASYTESDIQTHDTRFNVLLREIARSPLPEVR